MTWLGGDCWVPMPCFRKEKTVTMRTKEVMRIRSEGARVRTVMMKRMFRTVAMRSGSSA